MQTNFNTPPNENHPLSTLPGPDDILRAELPNDIILLSRANFDSPSVVINGYLPAGSIFDPDEKLGLANFTASALMRGTDNRDFQAIFDALESVGASLYFGCGTHMISFSGRALPEDLDLLLDLLAEALKHPTFPIEQVERLRAQLLTSLAIRHQDTAQMASLTFDQIVYNGHPYSRPQDGFSQTVEGISRQDLDDFRHQHYGPYGMVISVVGAVDPSHALEKTARTLGDWHNPAQPKPPELPAVVPLNEIYYERFIIPGKSQSDIVLGAAGPARTSPDFMAASLGNNIFGQFGMMGRIGEAVREKLGLAYYASSNVSGGSGPGPWLVSAGVDPGNVERVVEIIRDELARFVNEQVSQEELLDSKSNYIGRLPLSLEANAGVAAALTHIERYQLGLDYYRRYSHVIQAITAEDILETARRYLDPNRIAVAVAGP